MAGRGTAEQGMARHCEAMPGKVIVAGRGMAFR